MQPLAFVRPLATRFARAIVRPPRIETVTPRIAWPPSVRHDVTSAKVRLPRFWRFALMDSCTGRRTYEVLCAAFARFGVPVPGVYGTNTPFHACDPRVRGFVKTPWTENAAIRTDVPCGEPCGGGRYGVGKQIIIFADANAASGPAVTWSTYIGRRTVVPWRLNSSTQTASCVPGEHGFVT